MKNSQQKSGLASFADASMDLKTTPGLTGGKRLDDGQPLVEVPRP